MESRQVKEAGNTCLRGKNGIQASKRGGKYLPERENKETMTERMQVWENLRLRI